MRAVRRDVILVRVSAYGQTGPYRDLPGYARIAHAFAGLAYLAGEADSRPVIPGSTSLADYISGLYAALGALLAVEARRNDGQGQVVDVALYEGILRMFDDMIPRYASTGFIRQRMGPDTINQVPHSHYLTRDGQWVALACSDDRMWQRMTLAMGRPELAESCDYALMPARIARMQEVNAIVQTFIGTLDRDALIEHCRAFGVPIGPINSVADLFADPHIRSRGNLLQIEVPDIGPVVVPNVFPHLSGTPGEFRWPGPKLGEHNEEIYRGRLCLGDEEISQLKTAGVI
jgi:crotonobetainyl-CoA:carnitine CoA-transferase CaiB-like acyl-CoA transferase